MKRKWIITAMGLVAAFLLVVFYPILEEPSKELGAGEILESYTVTYMGFMGGTSERYIIFENGTVLYDFNPSANRTTFSITLSPEKIQGLKDFITQKRYSQKTHSLLYGWLAGSYAGYSSEIIIKDGQKTVKINNDPVISEILGFVHSMYIMS
jgi:hypothetical protein